MKIILCDDEPSALKRLKSKISARFPEAKIRTVTSGEELLALKNLGDMIFLDVEMPEMDGMETARRIRLRDPKVFIIFLTGHDEKVFEAFEVDAFRYLIKPVSDEQLYNVIESAISKKEASKIRNLMISVNGTHLQIPFPEIIYAEVFNRLIRLHTRRGTYEYYGRLQDLETDLGEGFFRCHRSYLINLSFVTGYSQHDIFLDDRSSIPLSRQKYNDFLKTYIARIKGD